MEEAICWGSIMSLPFESETAIINEPSFMSERSSFTPPNGLSGPIKRSIDLLIVLGTFLFTLPLLVVIAIIIKVQDGGPIFFAHERSGLNGKKFRCLKFRSMSHRAKPLTFYLENDPALAKEWAEMQKLRRDPRVTKFGQFLRKSSLDELPQILNIFWGDMSVVGPRPVPQDELHRYGTDAEIYRAARPGITGLWQINGRNNTTYQERINFDVDYVKNWSLVRDFKILFMTIPVVVFGKGAY